MVIIEIIDYIFNFNRKDLKMYTKKYKPNIMKLVDDYQYKYGISFQRTDGSTYKTLRVFAILSFAYLILTSLIYILGSSPLAYDYKHIFQVTLISSIIYTAAFVLMFFKFNLIGLLLNIAATLIKLPIITILFEGYIVNKNIYWRIIIPICLVLLFSAIMCYISTREKVIISRDYKAVLDKLYNQHHTDDMTEEDWSEFIDNY